jgi:hypothetical protein
MPVVDNSALDGNALGGLLHEVFGTEMTTAAATCASCGSRRQLAEFVVYLGGPGAVARCRDCLALLMVITKRRTMNCVDLTGLSALSQGGAWPVRP